MALTPSNMLALGTQAPDFQLFDTVSDKNLSWNDIKGERGTVVMFLCNHCPYVIHVLSEIVNIANDYQSQGIGFVAISSNDVVEHEEDSPDNMKTLAVEVGFTFPYLFDETQDIAKAYDAACTPDFYVFDKKGNLAYRGRLDNSRPNNGIPLSGKDLRTAINTILAEKEVSPVQFPSMGCNIKWK